MSVTANSTKLTITGIEPDINTIVIDGVTYDISDYDGTLASIGPDITVSSDSVIFTPGDITVNNLQSTPNNTLSYTPSNVTDSCLVVFVSSEDVQDNEPVTGISFGATAMTLEVIGNGVLGSNSNDVAIAYLINPGTTAQTITITGGERLGIAALTLGNVKQAGSVDVSNGTATSTSIATVTTTATTSNANSFVVSAGVTGDESADMSVTGGFEILEFTPTSAKMAIATSKKVVAGTYSHQYTSTIAGRTAAASIAFNQIASGGSISATATLGAISYASKNTSVLITGSVDVATTLGAINYSSKNTSVSITGDIELISTLGLINYSSKNAAVSVGGSVSLATTLGTIDYASQSASVNLTGAVNVNTTLGTITYSSKNAVVELAGLIDINATLGLLSYNSNNTTVSLGSGQIFGTVTASFKPDQITVTFKV